VSTCAALGVRAATACGTADRYRLIAPDYSGFGHTETPNGFTYSFERLADVMEGFVERLGLTRFVLCSARSAVRLRLRRSCRLPAGDQADVLPYPSVKTGSPRSCQCQSVGGKVAARSAEARSVSTPIR
jgi:hypothetical protein